MPVRITSVGKKHGSWVAEGIESYQKRLKRPFQIEWVIFTTFSPSWPHSASGRVWTHTFAPKC